MTAGHDISEKLKSEIKASRITKNTNLAMFVKKNIKHLDILYVKYFPVVN